MAPEVLYSKPYTAMVDAWSVGVILYELLALERPFNAADLDELKAQVTEEAPHRPRHVPLQRPSRPLRVPPAPSTPPTYLLPPAPLPPVPFTPSPSQLVLVRGGWLAGPAWSARPSFAVDSMA